MKRDVKVVTILDCRRLYSAVDFRSRKLWPRGEDHYCQQKHDKMHDTDETKIDWFGKGDLRQRAHLATDLYSSDSPKARTASGYSSITSRAA